MMWITGKVPDDPGKAADEPVVHNLFIMWISVFDVVDKDVYQHR